MPKYSGADWLESSLRKELNGRSLSPFERKVADLIGQAEYGFYHLKQDEYWGGASVWSDQYVMIHLHSDLATYDSNRLTRYVMLAHLLGIRLDITPTIQFYMTDSDDHENTWMLPDVCSYVCPSGYTDEGYVEDDVEEEIENMDFDSSQPESEENKKTITANCIRSGRAVLQLMFHQRTPWNGEPGPSNFQRHPTLDYAVRMMKELALPIMEDSNVQSTADSNAVQPALSSGG